MLKKIYVNAMKAKRNILAYLDPERKNIRQFQISEIENDVKREAIEWIKRFQLSGGGISRGYYYGKGADRPYPETTGYILQTLIEEQIKNEIQNKPAIENIIEYLIRSQHNSGGYFDTAGKELLVFDTGQILYGLNAAYVNRSKLELRDEQVEGIYKAGNKAIDWILESLDIGGKWIRGSFNGIQHSYYTRVSGIILAQELRTLSGSEIDKLISHQELTVDKLLENGQIDSNRFHVTEIPYLHNICYVYEGLLLGIKSKIFSEKRKEIIVKRFESLVNAKKGNNGLHASQYLENGEIWDDNAYCVTGLAQLSILIKEFKQLGARINIEYGRRINLFLQSIVVKKGINKGGLTGSWPVNGGYATYCVPNWGVKFFIDSCSAYPELQRRLDRMSTAEKWVSEIFESNKYINTNNDKVTKNILFYCSCIKEYIDKNDSIKGIIDVGCGNGRLMKILKTEMPNLEIMGIEPSAVNSDNGLIERMRLTDIKDGAQEMLIFTEVIQHVQDFEEYFRIINNKLKHDGVIIIGERYNRGLQKFKKYIKEYRNKWMYDKHSPLKEIWLDKKEWAVIIRNSGLRLQKIIQNKEGTRIVIIARKESAQNVH